MVFSHQGTNSKKDGETIQGDTLPICCNLGWNSLQEERAVHFSSLQDKNLKLNWKPEKPLWKSV